MVGILLDATREMFLSLLRRPPALTVSIGRVAGGNDEGEDNPMEPGRERAKAWIYSVINPLLEAARTQSVFSEETKLDVSLLQ